MFSGMVFSGVFPQVLSQALPVDVMPSMDFVTGFIVLSGTLGMMLFFAGLIFLLQVIFLLAGVLETLGMMLSVASWVSLLELIFLLAGLLETLGMVLSIAGLISLLEVIFLLAGLLETFGMMLSIAGLISPLEVILPLAVLTEMLGLSLLIAGLTSPLEVMIDVAALLRIKLLLGIPTVAGTLQLPGTWVSAEMHAMGSEAFVWVKLPTPAQLVTMKSLSASRNIFVYAALGVSGLR